MSIAIEGLWHTYDDAPVLAGLDLSVPAGSIWGLVGANGAGKTTTLRILASLLRPDRGTVRVAGVDALAEPRALRTVLGYMPDGARVDDRLTVAELLDFFAAAWGLGGPARRRAVVATLELCALGPVRDRLVPELSKGQRQRVLLARTLLHDPKVLVLDEPASDLDPRARIELRVLLQQIRALGKTILLSSHILPELEPLCDGVAILVGGRVAAAGELSVVALRASGLDATWDLRFTAPAPDVARRLRELGLTVEVAPSGGGACVSVRMAGGDAAMADLVVRLVAAGVPPVGIAPRRAGLEGAFLDLTDGGSPCA